MAFVAEFVKRKKGAQTATAEKAVGRLGELYALCADNVPEPRRSDTARTIFEMVLRALTQHARRGFPRVYQ